MPKFLIEVPHETETLACARAIDAFLRAGSHFLTHAEWGCRDGDHRAWVILEVDTKEEARNVVPPLYRPNTRITRLTHFTLQEIEPLLKEHQG